MGNQVPEDLKEESLRHAAFGRELTTGDRSLGPGGGQLEYGLKGVGNTS
jgi:hypothetical protein